MSNEMIFWTQVASIITFVFVVFGLYRLLVNQKDATIELLKETANSLRDQLSEARDSTPDVLARSLSERISLLDAELERLVEDKEANQGLVYKKEEELRVTRLKAEELAKQISLAQVLLNDFLCPHCGAPLSAREYHTELVEYQGREIDVDRNHTQFECGYSVIDGKPQNPCNAQRVRNVSVVAAA